ncbi:SagB/ThcOx family dehydrogenase [Streptoverticillium reticulum]|uniref:SagB/ThcOx family dehydrogenase n=1 Tax=Streptomyces TaxID=1883 RepID=UPI003695D16E
MPSLPAPSQRGHALAAYLPYSRAPAATGGSPGTQDVPPSYKRYARAPRTVLPWHAPDPGTPQGRLSLLLRETHGLVRERWLHPLTLATRPLGTPPVATVGRPAPSGGARYPTEVYVSPPGSEQQAQGLYHYDPVHHALEQVRGGDHRAALTAALGEPPAAPATTVLVITTVFWRTGVKYGEFGYRLQTQEAGVLAAQALAAGSAVGARGALHLSFDDLRVNALLGLPDGGEEAALAVVTFTHDEDAPPAPRQTGEAPGVPVVERPSQPVLAHRLPVGTALHWATMRAPTGAGRAPRPSVTPPSPSSGTDVRLPPVAAEPDRQVHRLPSPLRGFLPHPAPLAALATVLAAASAPCPGDLDGLLGSEEVRLHCLASRVEGVAPGLYAYGGAEHVLRPTGGQRALEELCWSVTAGATRLAWAESAFTLFATGDPQQVHKVAELGDRWYRVLQARTGAALHRAALAAAGWGLAARIFSDTSTDAVAAFLGCADGSQVLAALPVGRTRPGPAVDRRAVTGPGPTRS